MDSEDGSIVQAGSYHLFPVIINTTRQFLCFERLNRFFGYMLVGYWQVDVIGFTPAPRTCAENTPSLQSQQNALLLSFKAKITGFLSLQSGGGVGGGLARE